MFFFFGSVIKNAERGALFFKESHTKDRLCSLVEPVLNRFTLRLNDGLTLQIPSHESWILCWIFTLVTLGSEGVYGPWRGSLGHFLLFSRWRALQATLYKEMRGSPIGFFSPVIATQNSVDYRNFNGYFWHSTSRSYFQSRISGRIIFLTREKTSFAPLIGCNLFAYENLWHSFQGVYLSS